MQQKLRVLHETFFTEKIALKQNLRVPSRSRILTVFTKVKEIFYWEVKKGFFFKYFRSNALNLTSDVHFQAVVIKKEEQQTFPVDIEVK